MSKKKPVAKRLKNLFQNVDLEVTSSEFKHDPGKVNAGIPVKFPSPVNIEPISPRTRPQETAGRVTPKGENGLSLALQTGQNNWATLQVIDESDERKWGPDEKLLVRQVADQLSLALENAQLFQETQSRAQELSVLNEVGKALAAALNIEQITNITYNGISRLFGAENFYLAFLDEKNNEIVFPHTVSESVIDTSITRLALDKGITAHMIHTKESVLISDGSDKWMQEHGEIPVGDSARSFLGVPLVLGNKVLGAIAIQDYKTFNRYDEHDLRLLTSFASQAAIAIENARLFDSTKQSELEFRALFSAMDDVLIVYDRDGRYIRIAPTNPKGLFLPPQELLGKTINEILPSNLHKLFLEAIQKALDTDTLVKIEYPLEIKNSVFWFDASVTKLDKNQVFWIARDITDRKRNELVQKTLAQISEAGLNEPNLTSLIKTVHDSVIALMPNRDLFISLYDERADTINYPYAQHASVASNDQQKILTGFLVPQKPGRGLTSYVLRTGNPLLCTPEVYRELERKGEVVGEEVRKTEWLGIPLKSGRKRLGVISVRTFAPEDHLTQDDLSTLSIIGSQVSVTIERKRSQEELAKFKLGIDHTENAVFITDRQGVIEYINPGFEKIYGFTPEEAIGQTPRILKSGLVPTEQYKNLWKTLLSGGSVSGELVNRAKDGRLLPISGTNSPILDESGMVIGFLSVQQNITEQKRSEETLKRRNDYLSATAEIGRLVTSTFDLNTLFLRTVNLVRERFGFYHASVFILEETGFNAVVREATGDAGLQMKLQKHSLAVGSRSMVGEATKTGSAIVVNDTATNPIHKPNPLLPDTCAEAVIPLKVGARIIGALDIQSTKVNAFTKEDVPVLQSLADQIAVAIDNARSYELLQQAIKDLREIDKIKSQFLANMSHELRTPLNSIIGFSRVILKGIDGPVTDMQQQDLTAIYNSGQHLLGLINDILDLARIEAGKMELNFEEVHLSEMANSVLSTAKGLVKEKPIRLISKIPADMPTVRGDTMRIRQIFINLLSNASKFTDEGSITVETKIQTGPSGNLEAFISVIDTGPGISFEDQEKLFKAFSQVDGSATRKSGGSGLGLSICANLVQLHGGRINVHSQVGKGSTFWFTLPLYNQPLGVSFQGKKIVLAIDDDPQVIGLYERYLNLKGYHVVALNDPSRARETILEIKPYAITLDIMMPNIDGWTLLTTLKSDPATRDFPVIVCSILEQAEKGFNLGASDYLIKPILEEDLVGALSRLDKHDIIPEILVIADDPNDLHLMEKILRENSQYNPVLAEGERKGWELINTKTPDAIILDLFMPDTDGFLILEKIRNIPSLRDIPLLVVSDEVLTHEQQALLNTYGHRLIAKSSFKEGELIASVERALQRIEKTDSPKN